MSINLTYIKNINYFCNFLFHLIVILIKKVYFCIKNYLILIFMQRDCKYFRFYKDKPHKLNMYCLLHKSYVRHYFVFPCFCKDFDWVDDADIHLPIQLELF